MYFIDIETIPELDIYKCDPYNERTAAHVIQYTNRFKKQIAEIDALPDTKERNTLAALSNDGIYDHAKSLHYTNNAGLYAEHGRILCVALGTEKSGRFYVKYFANRLEKDLLTEVATKLMDAPSLCGHNIKEFDFPFLFRRMLVNGIKLQPIFQTYGKKPWDIVIDDTMNMWSATQWNYKCSLDLLAHTLGLPSPKAEMSGSKVADVWFNEPLLDGELPFDRDDRVLKKIGTYCMGDVVTTAKVYCRLRGLPDLTDENIVYL